MKTFFKQALDFFLSYYREHKLDHTVVYAGIPEALKQIQSNGRRSERWRFSRTSPCIPRARLWRL